MCERNWWEHSPESVVDDAVKTLWDFYIYTNHVISARQLDFVTIDKSLATTSLVYVSIPADKNILAKEDEKLTKYQDLRIELERLWQKCTRMVSVVIGALGAVSQ